MGRRTEGLGEDSDVDIRALVCLAALVRAVENDALNGHGKPF
jgi:hypothetical protein